MGVAPEREQIANLGDLGSFCSRTGTKLLKLGSESCIVTGREQYGDRMTAKKLGELVKKRRKKLGLNQSDLALASGTGRRFISDLENGKDSCELGKTLKVLAGLGIELIRDSEAKGGE